jgi:undecaprenyl pyrophosphate phosphatase UppP
VDSLNQSRALIPSKSDTNTWRQALEGPDRTPLGAGPILAQGKENMAEVCTQSVDTGFVALGYAKVSVLGVVQGITELLPISSTAHIRVLPALLGWQDPGSAFSAAMQLAAALLLAFAEVYARHKRTIAQASMIDALLVGIAQVGALIPGVSRSGSTLTAALALGFQRDEAARFSFLLGLPAIALAG